VGDGRHVTGPPAEPTRAAPAAARPAAPDRRREQRGWYFYDWADSAFSTTVLTVFLGPYLSTVAGAAADADGYVHPLGLDVRAKAIFPFAVAVSVAAQVLVLPLAGAFATMGLYFVTGGRYLLGAGLFGVWATSAAGCCSH
jgi:MFS transporter, UMF1 family